VEKQSRAVPGASACVGGKKRASKLTEEHGRRIYRPEANPVKNVSGSGADLMQLGENSLRAHASAFVYSDCMKAWTMVLRCHRCAGKFTLHEMPLERLSSLPLVAACPHCGALPRSRR
jgi:hypothetical protein